MKANLDQATMNRVAAAAVVRTSSKDDIKVEKAKSIDSGVLNDLMRQLSQGSPLSGAELKLLKLFLDLLEQLSDNVSASQSPTIAGNAFDEAPASADAAHGARYPLSQSAAMKMLSALVSGAAADGGASTQDLTTTQNVVSLVNGAGAFGGGASQIFVNPGAATKGKPVNGGA